MFDFADIRPSVLNAAILLFMILVTVPAWKLFVAWADPWLPNGIKTLTGMI